MNINELPPAARQAIQSHATRALQSLDEGQYAALSMNLLYMLGAVIADAPQLRSELVKIAAGDLSGLDELFS